MKHADAGINEDAAMQDIEILYQIDKLCALPSTYGLDVIDSAGYDTRHAVVTLKEVLDQERVC
jgi:hypothetical protein